MGASGGTFRLCSAPRGAAEATGIVKHPRAQARRMAPPEAAARGASLRARLARPWAAIPLAALAQVLLALLGWSLLAGGLCGSSDRRDAILLAAWVGPSLLAALLARLVLRASLLSVLLSVAAGLALSFATFLGVVFPVCG